MELESAQEAFVHLLGQLKPECKSQFLDWVHVEYSFSSKSECTAVLNDGLDEISEEPDLLNQIAADLRSVVPPTAIAPDETQHYPTVGQNADLSPATTLHVDSFLYSSEEQVDELCSQLEISRNYCLNCGSWKTLPLNFISHSMSREQLKFIFCDLLPDLNGKTVLDIGSRMGPVLYAAYIHSQAQHIVGIEVNSYFSEMQARVVSKYGLSSRVKVVNADIRHQAELLQAAHVIVMNNVFEFFCSLEEQTSIWEFLFQTIRKNGTLLVTVPSIQESCRHLTFKVPVNLEQWVTEVTTGVSPDDEELGNIHLYCVL